MVLAHLTSKLLDGVLTLLTGIQPSVEIPSIPCQVTGIANNGAVVASFYIRHRCRAAGSHRNRLYTGCKKLALWGASERLTREPIENKN